MPHLYLCLVWHMHQPFYRDLISGEYRLPWTRLHALKDYYGMVRMLGEFPEVHQTFNLVPSLLVQIEEYASGQAADPFLRCSLKRAEELSEDEQSFVLHYFFQANPARMIRRWPRYGELYDAWLAANRDPRRARHFFAPPALRDLQVLSQLAWFDEELLAEDAQVRRLLDKGAHFSLEDQAVMGRKQIEILGRVIPTYRGFAGRGQIEISTTPFYHPILPLLCDSQVADQAHAGVPLPSRFSYPGDAREQLELAGTYMESRFGRAPVGLWPSEGSVSDATLGIAAECGFRWIASDNGVLGRTLHLTPDVELTYRPYLWRQDGREIHAIFRDHFLSDLIGFVYSRMGPAEAANHFLELIRENCRGLLASGRDALVPVILDGENAWEHYAENGRPFLKELYRRISADPEIRAVTVSEALARIAPQTLDHVAPGSWIHANFDVWIGSEEDNRAWEYLLRARQTYDRVVNGPGAARPSEENKRLAREELLIAEGSDWCWWYGPEHQSENRPEFDQLFRAHLANVYRALGQTPPEELSRPILKVTVQDLHEAPTAPIHPVIDGEVTSYFEWMGAGRYRVDIRSGAMHGQGRLIHEMLYGSDGQNLYLRIDFLRHPEPGLQARLSLPNAQLVVVEFRDGYMAVTESTCAVEAAFVKVFEVRVPLAPLSSRDTVRLQMSFWLAGLPVDALPQEEWLEISTAEPRDWPV